MDNQKKYYVLNNSQKQLVCFTANSGVAEDIREFNGADWIPADYETKSIVEKAVKFDVIGRPAVATQITTEEALDKIVVEKISKLLNRDDPVM